MKRTGFLKACSKLMAFVLTAGITVGAFVADPGNDMLVSAKDGNCLLYTSPSPRDEQ